MIVARSFISCFATNHARLRRKCFLATATRRTNLRIFLSFVILFFHQHTYAQFTVLCPEAGTTTFDTPKIIFPVQPVQGQPWHICYKSPGRCYAPTQLPDAPLVNLGATIEIRKSFILNNFALCPPPRYVQLLLPAPTQVGALTFKYFWRTANSEGVLNQAPFVLQEEQVLHVLGSNVVQQLPALDYRSAGALVSLIVVLGFGAIRRWS